MKITSIAALMGAASAAPMAFINADGTTSEHVSGGLAHDSARHDERCAAGENIDCHVEEGWSFGACSTTCGQGTATRTRAVTVTPCNNGAACPSTSQTRECMHTVCMCEKVECKFETHSCTHYQDAQTGVQYHSDVELWSGYGNAPNGNVAAANAMVATPTSATARHTSIVDRDTRGSTGNAGFTSAFDNRHDEVNAATGNVNYGAGDQHGIVTSTDSHYFSGTCANAESVRVYHKNEAATMGHHCKHTKGGQCKCKCNRLFKGSYNPRTLDLYDHTIALPVDGPTLQPTSHPTAYPTPYPTPACVPGTYGTPDGTDGASQAARSAPPSTRRRATPASASPAPTVPRVPASGLKAPPAGPDV